MIVLRPVPKSIPTHTSTPVKLSEAMASDTSTNSYKFEDDYIKINADPTISSINMPTSKMTARRARAR